MKARETLLVCCDFCLEVLEEVNIKRFNSGRNRDLMLAHQSKCPLWSKLAARVMRYQT